MTSRPSTQTAAMLREIEAAALKVGPDGGRGMLWLAHHCGARAAELEAGSGEPQPVGMDALDRVGLAAQQDHAEGRGGEAVNVTQSAQPVGDASGNRADVATREDAMAAPSDAGMRTPQNDTPVPASAGASPTLPPAPAQGGELLPLTAEIRVLGGCELPPSQLLNVLAQRELEHVVVLTKENGAWVTHWTNAEVADFAYAVAVLNRTLSDFIGRQE